VVYDHGVISPLVKTQEVYNIKYNSVISTIVFYIIDPLCLYQWRDYTIVFYIIDLLCLYQWRDYTIVFYIIDPIIYFFHSELISIILFVQMLSADISFNLSLLIKYLMYCLRILSSSVCFTLLYFIL
jgi:hypothetical protein